ncbi:MAG: GNAT family N-acetyltransferase [Promethearchaeia archaeon]
MIVREFTEEDIDGINKLMKDLCSLKGQIFDEDRWQNSIREDLKPNSNSEILVAIDQDDKNVIGMANCSVKTAENGTRFGYISNLIVKEGERGSGVGEKLMKNMIDYFKRNHIRSIRLALKTNLDEAARLLFVKLGFKEIIRIYELKI